MNDQDARALIERARAGVADNWGGCGFDSSRVIELTDALSQALDRLELAEKACEAADRVEPHAATLEMSNRWAKLYENLKAWRTSRGQS